jgi:hypothetical protein
MDLHKIFSQKNYQKSYLTFYELFFDSSIVTIRINLLLFLNPSKMEKEIMKGL